LRMRHPGSSRAGDRMLLTGHPGLIRSHQHRGGSGGKSPTLADSIASDDKKCGMVVLDCQGAWMRRGATARLSTVSSGRAYGCVVGSQCPWRTVYAVPSWESENL
jgi:hypothetical protein